MSSSSRRSHVAPARRDSACPAARTLLVTYVAGGALFYVFQTILVVTVYLIGSSEFFSAEHYSSSTNMAMMVAFVAVAGVPSQVMCGLVFLRSW